MPLDLPATQAWAMSHRAAWELVPLVEMVRNEKRQTGYVLNLYARIPVEIPPSEERRQVMLATWDRLGTSPSR